MTTHKWWFIGDDGAAQVSMGAVGYNTSELLQAFTFDGVDLDELGNTFDVNSGLATTTRTTITPVGENKIVLAGSDGFNDFYMRRISFDGTDWANDSNAFTATSDSSYSSPRVAGLTATRVALAAGGGGLRTFDEAGGTWSQTGNILAGPTGLNSMCAYDDASVVVFDSGTLAKYDFDGTDWAVVGSGLVGIGVQGAAMVMIDSTTMAFVSTTDEEIRAYTVTAGGSISLIAGSQLASSGIAQPSLCLLEEDRLVLGRADTGQLQVVDWNGSVFSGVGASKAFALAEKNVLAGAGNTVV